jgi:predicted transcriptional regulator
MDILAGSMAAGVAWSALRKEGVVMSETKAAVLLPFKLATLCRLLGAPVRWFLIRELCKGEALPLGELARRVGCSPDLTSKHLAVMRKFGLVVLYYGQLYRIAPAFQPKPGETTLDLCHCILKLDTTL